MSFLDEWRLNLQALAELRNFKKRERGRSVTTPSLTLRVTLEPRMIPENAN